MHLSGTDMISLRTLVDSLTVRSRGVWAAAGVTALAQPLSIRMTTAAIRMGKPPCLATSWEQVDSVRADYRQSDDWRARGVQDEAQRHFASHIAFLTDTAVQKR